MQHHDPSDRPSADELARLRRRVAELENATPSSVEYLEGLLEINRAISSTLDLDQVLDLVLEKLGEVLPYDSASIFLLSDGVARVAAGKGYPDPDLVLQIAVPVEDDPLTHAVISRGRPLILRDAQADPRFRNLGGTEYVRSWIGVPLIARGAPVGFMGVDHGEVGVYDEESGAKVEAFARQAAIAIENALLFEQAQAEIAERKRAERLAAAALKAQHESERRYRRIVETAYEGIWVLNVESRTTYVNQRMADMLGYTVDEMMGRPLYDFLNEGRRREAERYMQRRREGIPEQHDFSFRRKDGSELWATLSTSPLTDDAGAYIGALGMVTDITKRRRAAEARERALEALEQQLARNRLLNEIVRAMSARHDLESILRVVVQRLEAEFTDLASIWLYDAEDGMFSLAHVGDRSGETVRNSALPPKITIPSHVTEAMMREGAQYLPDMTQARTSLVRRMAESLGVRAAVIAPLSAEDALLGVLASQRRGADAFSQSEREFLSDLAVHVGLAVRQARLHQELRDAYDDLRETQQAVMQQERLRALGQMASGIAHDINNAVAPIPLYTSLVEREAALNERATAHLRTIETAVSDIEETVSRLRRFYRRSDEEEDLLPVDVNEIAAEAIRLTRPRWRDVPQAQGTLVDMQADLQPDLPPVMGLEGEIRQAVTNLILNALQAMPDGGTLTLRTRAQRVEPAHVVLEVSDTGIGMDEETQRRCFEPFYSTKGKGGSGMGLATVYGTMQRHGGDVQLESALGAGTSVRLIFPPMRERAGNTAGDESAAPASPLRILCIDDEPLIREALRETLESEGHTVEIARDGATGLAAFNAAQARGEPFAVIITDLGMPAVDGREVARRVKAEAPETPVILLTGWGLRLSAERDIPTGVDLLLNKPPTADALNRALAQVAPEDPSV